MKYIVWSFRHNQWWGPDHRGYTSDPSLAGRYARGEAADIMLNALPGQNVAFDERLALQSGSVEEKIADYRSM